MATYTDNYQLTKPLYSETADVAAINNNMDKIDDIMHASQISLAPAYDQNETYNTGDVVMYEFLMYECLEDNVTGVWDATKWQRTTAGEHGGGSSASEVSYDNTNSGLEADNVQDALDEIVENIPSVEANPQGAATDELTKIEIGGTVYGIREEITGEASGAIASFADGSANPLKSLVVDINPVQAGSGTPAPDNVRPISGWSSVGVTVAGKNKFDYSAVTDLNGMSNNNGVFTNTATDTKTMFAFAVQQFNGSSYVTQNMLDISTAGRYSVTFTVSQEITKLRIKHNGSTQDLRLDYPFTTQGTFTVSFTIISANPSIVGGLSFKDVMIESGSTATSYEPYNATTYTIQLGDTYYGGKLNVTTGELTVDRYLYSFTGNETFVSNPSAWGNYAFLYNTGVNLKSSFSTLSYCKSSHLDAVNAGGWSYLTPNTFMIAGTTYMGIGFDGTEAELKAWLAAQNTANTPVQIMGVLETPTTIELTPTEVDSLPDNNNIWADSGDVVVVYIRDIDKAFNILWNAVMNSNSGTRSLNLMKGAISETKEDIEEPIKEEEETKEGKDENQR